LFFFLAAGVNALLIGDWLTAISLMAFSGAMIYYFQLDKDEKDN